MMLFVNQIFSLVIVGVLILACLVLLGCFIRFSIISEWRTRGWQKRLRQPQVDEVAANWRVQIPPVLESLYREADFIERDELCLAHSASLPAAEWYIHHFIPFTVVDLREWIKITGVPGLPIATGGDDGKSTYYLPFKILQSGLPVPILLRPAGLPDIEVAPTIEDFMRFQTMEETDEEE